VETLLRLGLLSRSGSGELTLTGKNFTTTDRVRSSAVRKGHENNLNLARKSLESDPVDARDFSAITMAIDPARLEEATQLIREFRDRICTFLEGGKKQQVYKLCIQLFPMTADERGVNS
jgi:uncharacterized protein (TIGR02147 family)